MGFFLDNARSRLMIMKAFKLHLKSLKKFIHHDLTYFCFIPESTGILPVRTMLLWMYTKSFYLFLMRIIFWISKKSIDVYTKNPSEKLFEL